MKEDFWMVVIELEWDIYYNSINSWPVAYINAGDRVASRPNGIRAQYAA
jgi:hypothetical protein